MGIRLVTPPARRPLSLAVATALALGAHAPAALSADWNAGTGDWNTAGNWSPAAVPTGTDAVTIGNGGTAQVQSAAAAAQSVTISNGALSIAGSRTLTTGSVQLSGGALNIGAGTTTGILNAPSVVGTGGSPTINFNHNNSNYFFSTTGTVSGTALTIDGTLAVEHTGVGRTILSGNNTYTGGTTISAGTLQVGNGGLTGSIVGDVVVDNGTLELRRSNAVTFSGIVSGTGALVKSGGGTTTLTATNTYTGGTAVNGGVLVAGAAGALVNNTAYSTGGGTLNLNNLALTASSLSGSSGGVNLGSAALTVNQSAHTNYGGNIVGTGSLTKSGTGILTLDGTNTYSGGTTISAGTLRIGNFGSIVGNVVNGGALGFYNIGDLTFAGSISGGGTLLISGGWAVTMTAANSYTGGTTIDFGTLRAGVAGALVNNTAYAVNTGRLELNGFNLTASSLSGTAFNGTVDLGSATLTVNQSSNTTFAGSITGTGSLIKSGSGTLTITGDNVSSGTSPYSGATQVTGGTLRGGAPGAFSSASQYILNAGTTLDLAGNNQTIGSLNGAGNVTLGAGTLTTGGDGTSTTYAGNINGNGGLTKTGSGAMTLTGNNSYAGATTINAGVLRAGAPGAFSTASRHTVDTGATLDLAGNSQTIGSLSGAGNVTLGAGTLTIGGADTSSNYAGTISGNGGLTKTGSTSMALTGNNSYTGATTVNSGTLIVMGSLASVVTVNSGALLLGAGTVGGANVMSGGMFAPGISIGTMTVNGNVGFAAGSTYYVQIDPAGNGSRIAATGTATLAGGTVAVQAGGGTYRGDTRYTILTAAGGVSGNFSNLSASSNLAFLTPSLSYDANNVFLTLTSTLAEPTAAQVIAVARTPNQVALLNYIRAVANTPVLGGLIARVESLTAEEAREAFASIGGDSLSAPGMATMNESGRFLSTLSTRLGGSDTGLAFSGLQLAAGPVSASDAPPLYAQAGTPAAATRPGERGFWMLAGTSHGTTKSDGNGAGFDWNGGGATFGVDAEIAPGTVVGAAFSYGRTTVDADFDAGTTKVRSPRVALYGSRTAGAWELRGAAGYGDLDYDTRRNVTVGASTDTASASHAGQEWSLYGEAQYTIRMGSNQLKPLAGLRYISLTEEGYTETGSIANLAVDGRKTESMVSLLGTRYTLPFAMGRGEVELRAIWSHEFGDVDPAVSGRLAAAPVGPAFTVSGVAVKRDALTLGTGFTSELSKNFSLYGDLNTELRGGDQRAQALVAGLRYIW